MFVISLKTNQFIFQDQKRFSIIFDRSFVIPVF